MKKKRLFSYLAVMAVLLAAFLLMGASCSVSTANIQNPVTTTGMDNAGKPLAQTSEFAANSPVYAVVELHNAPDETKVTFKWYSGNTFLDQITVANTMSDQYISSHVPGLDAGNYKVEIYVDDREKSDATIDFTVK